MRKEPCRPQDLGGHRDVGSPVDDEFADPRELQRVGRCSAFCVLRRLAPPAATTDRPRRAAPPHRFGPHPGRVPDLKVEAAAREHRREVELPVEEALRSAIRSQTASHGCARQHRIDRRRARERAVGLLQSRRARPTRPPRRAAPGPCSSPLCACRPRIIDERVEPLLAPLAAAPSSSVSGQNQSAHHASMIRRSRR